MSQSTSGSAIRGETSFRTDGGIHDGRIQWVHAVPSAQSKGLPDAHLFSICTLVSRDEQYREMCASFFACGFCGAETEFIALDNRARNEFDGYSGLRVALGRARGRYIVFCHQDVRLIGDGRSELEARLHALDALDPDWALAGNAGGHRGGLSLRITDPHGVDQAQGTFPQLVDSLDENFIVLRRSAGIAPSATLRGFHLYGLDLALQARLLARTAYVIDFHLQHLSAGKVDAAYLDCLEAIEDRYFGLLELGRVQTTCMAPIITSSRLRLAVGRIRRWRRVRRIRMREVSSTKVSKDPHERPAAVLPQSSLFRE